jgi:predicted O-methyltransferase YrrM
LEEIMTSSLDEPRLLTLLDRLYAEAEASHEQFKRWMAGQSPEQLAAWRSSAADYRTLYKSAKDVYLAVPRSTARLLYILARNQNAHTIVEFGTSFGNSTLHLAAAVRDNGGGIVIGSEFEPGKVVQARRNVADAGLADVVEIREGDALDTLAHDVPAVVDLVFLDGAKSLYRPVFRLLEAHLPVGALIVADNADNASDYVEYFHHSDDYLSTGLDGGIEVSIRTDRQAGRQP